MTAKKATQTTKKAEDVKINAPVKTVETAKTAKTETAAPAVKAEVKAEEKEIVKEAAKETVKAEAPKAEVKAETAKAEAPKAEPKKRGRKPKAVKEAETAKAAKTAKAEKKENVQNVYVQFEGREVLTSQLVAQVTENWVAMGHRASSIKELNLYVKPEDHAAYYVINGKVQGKIDL